MKEIEQIYTNCLAQGAYFIESTGEAAVIDPLRETAPYLERAEELGVKIKYIFETHFHADFVSGHLDLAKKTGATIVYGPMAETSYDIYAAQDGEELKVGNLTFKVLHTPGHTMESSVFLLKDETGKDYALFSGDTLFLGDVGRPDLAIKQDSVTKEDLAGFLFESLRNKIMPLSDEIIVYPAHGAGSACGKNLSKETWGYLGDQKKTNYALRADMSKEEFIREVTAGLTPPPQYFAKNAMMNKAGYENFDKVLERGFISLSPIKFEYLVEAEEALMLDTRRASAFAAAHIPNSINIGIDGGFAPWVGALITDITQPIILITEEGRAEEVVTRLARVGYDNTIGFLEGGIEAWKAAGKEIDTIESISPQEFENRINTKKVATILDARKPSEYLAHHIEGAENFPLDYINQGMKRLDKNKTYYIHCAGGYRSMITASILQARGYRNIVDVKEGFAGIEKTKIKLTDYVCPTTLSQEIIDKAVASVL